MPIMAVDEDRLIKGIQYLLCLIGRRRMRRTSESVPEAGTAELAFVSDPRRGLDRLYIYDLAIRSPQLPCPFF